MKIVDYLNSKKIGDKTLFGIGLLIFGCFIALCVVILNGFINNNSKLENVEGLNQSTVVTDTIKCSTFKFEFDNHDYIKFKTEGSEHIIHDPACTCLSKKLNNITTVIVNNDIKNGNAVNERLNRMEAQIKKFSVELEKKPKVIYVSKPTPTPKPQAKQNNQAKPAPKKK
jgi:lipoprotein